MTLSTVRDYAYAHARIRARIGLMPDTLSWQRIINSGDLETTIELMSASGLSYWVKDFPRKPSAGEIERRCLINLLEVGLFLK